MIDRSIVFDFKWFGSEIVICSQFGCNAIAHDIQPKNTALCATMKFSFNRDHVLFRAK